MPYTSPKSSATVTAEADNGQSYSMDLTVAGEGDVRIDLTVGETWSKNYARSGSEQLHA